MEPKGSLLCTQQPNSCHSDIHDSNKRPSYFVKMPFNIIAPSAPRFFDVPSTNKIAQKQKDWIHIVMLRKLCAHVTAAVNILEINMERPARGYQTAPVTWDAA